MRFIFPQFRILFVLLLISLFVSSCVKDEDFIVEGMAPIYISATDFTKVKSESPREFVDLGTIVNYRNYLLINEKNKGIHVIDNTNPNLPKNVAFWTIPGNIQFTVDRNTLFADNSIHLLVIDISDIYNIKVVNYIEDLYIADEIINPKPTENYKGYFYCVDKSKGVLTGWEQKTLTNPLCEGY